MANPFKADLAAAVKQARTSLMAGLGTAVVERQRETTQDREARGSVWVGRVKFPAPAEDDARQLIFDAIRTLGRGDEKYASSRIEDVRAQWTGYRAGVSPSECEPIVSEAKKYMCLMKEVHCPMTILYVYGGAHLYS